MGTEDAEGCDIRGGIYEGGIERGRDKMGKEHKEGWVYWIVVRDE